MVTTLERVKIVRNLQIPGAVLKNQILFVGLMTQSVAEDLGAKWLAFEKGGAVRDGFTAVDLDAEFADAKIAHNCGKLGKLLLPGSYATRFKAFRLGDGKKKPRRVMLRFIVEYTGNPFELLEHISRVGKGEGVVTIEASEQKKLAGIDVHSANDRGIFDGIKPLARFKCNDKGYFANFSVVEAKEGWHMGYQVQCGKLGGDAVPLRVTNGTYDSEKAAIEAAAGLIMKRAVKCVESAPRQSKKLCESLVEWASGFASPQGSLIQ